MNHHNTSHDRRKHSDTDNVDEAPLPFPRRTVLKGALATPLVTGGLTTVSDEVSGQQSSDEDWPQFQFDAANTGYNPNGSGPTTGIGQQWTFTDPTGPLNSPVVADGTVYVGSADGHLYAVNASDGTLAWPAFSANDVVKTPAIDLDQNVVFVGDRTGTIYALDTATGTQLDQVNISEGGGGGNIWAIKDGVLYANGNPSSSYAEADAIVAVDINYTSSGVELSKKWHNQTGECFGGGTNAAVADGIVYITEDCGKTWAIGASNGSVQWKFDDGTGDGSGSPPTVADGTVYFGTNTVEGDTNTVHALDAATGTEKDEWPFTFSPAGDVTSSPAVANGIVYFGSDNGNIYAVNASGGTLAWDEPFSTGGGVTSSPAVVSGVVYVGSNEGNVYMIDASTGDEIDRFGTGDAVGSAPAVANGNVYVGSNDSNLYGLQEVEANDAPTAAFDFEPEDPVVGTEIEFDASSSSDPDGSIASFEWDFDGDGSFEKTGEQVKHTFPEDGDFPVTLRVTDEDGIEDRVTKTVPVILDIQLEKVRLIQTVEDSRIPDVRDSVPDPDHVGGRQSIVGFGLGNKEAIDEIEELLDIGALSNLEFELFFNDSQSPDRTFKLKKEKIPDVMDSGIIGEAASGTGAGDLRDLFVDDDFPTFEMRNGLEKVTLKMTKTDNFTKSSRSLSKGEDYSFSTTPKLNLGFIPIRDSKSGQNYGTDGNGGPESYESSTEDILKYIDKSYPVKQVNAYIHNVSDPVLGTDIKKRYPFDLKDTRDEFELILQEFQKLSADKDLNGKLVTVENGALVEDPENIEISYFDETIAIVPGGTNSNNHYFEYHQIGSNKAGVHISEDTVFNVQPQTSSAVLEQAAALYDPEKDVTPKDSNPPNNYRVGEVGAHEIGHHFIDDPYSGSFSNLSAEIEGQDDPDHADEELVSTKVNLEQEPKNSELDVNSQVTSMMAGGDEPLWPDERAYQRLIKSQFNPQPKETDSEFLTVRKISGTVALRQDGRLDVANTLIRSGLPYLSAAGGDVIMVLKDVAGNTIDKLSTNLHLNADFFTGSDTIENIGLFVIPFPEETYRVEFELDGNTTVITPIVKSLFVAVSAIPDNGFKRVPDQQRRALNQKLEDIKEKIDSKEFNEAKQKLKNDFRRMIERWLKNEYDAAANEFTKQELLDLVEDMITRLDTLYSNN